MAPAPPALIPKGLASAGLLALIATAKFCDALPLYPQERQFSRMGVELSRRTMSDWMIAAAGEEPNLIFEDPPRKGGMFRAECAMMLQDLNPPVYQELNRTGALDEYLDLASHGNRDLYLSLTAQGKAGPQQQATAREVVLAQMREEIVSAQPAHC